MNTKYKIQNTKYKIKYKILNTKNLAEELRAPAHFWEARFK